MCAFIMHVGAVLLCPHGGQVTSITTNTRVMVAGQPVVVQNDTFIVAGCPFAPVKPQPCVMVKWIIPAMRVTVGGKPVLLQDSVGLCQSAEQIPQGPPNVITVQTRVKGM